MSLKIAIQKKGRLSEKSLELLRECGIHLINGNRSLKAKAKNFPIEVLFLRDDDIPQYIEQGIADAGIIGENEVLEKGKDVKQVQKLGFAQCDLCLAIPKGEEYTDLTYFKGKRVATSYPTILSKFFNEKGIDASIEVIGGSVEIAPGIGLAEGIFDIVSTGSTLFMNGLKPVETILRSEAVLVATKGLPKEKSEILQRLLFRIQAVLTSEEYKYILLNAPNDNLDEIISLLPGMKSPTVLPLAESGWSSVHSVIREDTFWEIIEQLKAKGAEGILVTEIEKMVL